MSIFDFFTREAGQERRRALEGLLTQFIPPEMRPQLGLLAEAQPIRGAERAGQGAVRVMNTQGMDRVQAIGDTLSEMAGVVAPAMVAGRAGVPVVNAVQDVLTGYSPMVQPFMADESGALRLFHGSPHDFDRFSMSKIGTGEGAQAYGHGLYFADSEAVARSYRDKLAPMNTNVKSALRDAGGDYDAAIAEAQRRVSVYEAMEPSRQRDGLLAINRTKLAELLSQKAGNAPSPGRMYEVNVNANPEDFLDWDKPLSEQSPKVQQVLQSFGARPEDVGAHAYSRAGFRKFAVMGPDGRWGPGGATRDESLAMVGGDATKLREILDPSAPKRSEGLLQAGIHGIRYLDAGSRGAGDGSRNYVVFDENLIEIVRKYGIAGAAAMLGMSQADVAQAMQQQPQPQGLLAGPQ